MKLYDRKVIGTFCVIPYFACMNAVPHSFVHLNFVFFFSMFCIIIMRLKNVGMKLNIPRNAWVSLALDGALSLEISLAFSGMGLIPLRFIRCPKN